jgi:membrane-associated PAP2 superfamily phosphatase
VHESFPERRDFVWLAVAMIVAAIVFSLWPGLDLATTGLFYTPGQGFVLDRSPALTTMRWAIWYLVEASVALTLLGLVLAVIRIRLIGLPLRVWGFAVLLFALGPGLLVNGVLKSSWGRARPADVVQFGGAHEFTPALLPAHECASNCSFVSGEGSASFALAVSAIVVIAALSPRLGSKLARVLTALAVVIALAGAAQRLMTGRHFLSDTVFAALFVIAIALVLFRLIRPLRRG